MRMENNVRQALSLLLSGAAGSALGVWFSRNPTIRWVDRIMMFAGGIAAAHFFTSPIMRYFKLAVPGDYTEAFAFAVGLFGMALFSLIFRALTNADLWGLIRDIVFSKTGTRRPFDGGHSDDPDVR